MVRINANIGKEHSFLPATTGRRRHLRFIVPELLPASIPPIIQEGTPELWPPPLLCHGIVNGTSISRQPPRRLQLTGFRQQSSHVSRAKNPHTTLSKMYSYTSYHPAGHEATKKAAALPTPAESNPLGAQVFGDGKSVPPFVLRFRKQLDDDPEQSQEPAVGETATMRTGNGQNQERFLHVMNDSDQPPAIAIESAGLDPYAAARAYPWRTTGSSPGPGHNDELKHTAYRPSNLGRAPHHASDSFHETNQRPGGLYYRVPQPGPFRQDTRRPLQEYSTANNDAYAQSNLAAPGYDVSTGAHMATALPVQSIPRQMPIKEFELLEQVKGEASLILV